MAMTLAVDKVVLAVQSLRSAAGLAATKTRNAAMMGRIAGTNNSELKVGEVPRYHSSGYYWAW